MQGVRKSAKGYLGKYMSKGVGAITGPALNLKAAVPVPVAGPLS